jgi:hypothetical protein
MKILLNILVVIFTLVGLATLSILFYNKNIRKRYITVYTEN